jgi:hypothetical protein
MKGGATRFVFYVRRHADGIEEIRSRVAIIYPPGVVEIINQQVRAFLAGEPVMHEFADGNVRLC